MQQHGELYSTIRRELLVSCLVSLVVGSAKAKAAHSKHQPGVVDFLQQVYTTILVYDSTVVEMGFRRSSSRVHAEHSECVAVFVADLQLEEVLL